MLTRQVTQNIRDCYKLFSSPGFHPSAAHLPQPVEPNHPEVAAAVAAQLAAAADHHYKRWAGNNILLCVFKIFCFPKVQKGHWVFCSATLPSSRADI